MRTDARWLVALVALCASGCGRNGSPAGRAGLPPAGNVRVVPARTRDDAKGFVWVWSIIGERNWTRAAINGSELRVSSSYPLNSGTDRGGTHNWKALITAEPAAGGLGTLYIVKVQLRGSTAQSTESSFTLDVGSGGSLASVVRALQSSETTLSLPATVPLATVGRRNIVLKVER